MAGNYLCRQNCDGQQCTLIFDRMSRNKQNKDAGRQSVRKNGSGDQHTHDASMHWTAKRSKLISLAVIVTLIVTGAGFFGWHQQSNDAVAAAPIQLVSHSEPSKVLPANRNKNFAPALASNSEGMHKQLIQQLEEVDHTLCAYREASKYPLGSRPISEHPDQIYPNQAIVEQHPMRLGNGRTNTAIQISSSQSRVYLAANESVSFTVQAKDTENKALALFVTRASSAALDFSSQRLGTQIPLAFADNGRDGDVQANDGIASGVFHPANSSLANFSGTIRTEIQYTVNGQSGSLFFDVIYSPELPATWTGNIREVLENGALVFYLPIEVRHAGRYIVNARLDDAKGQAFALLNFNDLLAQGRQEIRLSTAGNLIRDNQPPFPLSLRDIDGYLLKENVDPDRALIPRREALVHQSKAYPLKSFSDAEPDTEERRRYLTEFQKDLELAKAALLAFDPEQAKRPFPQSTCSKRLQSLAAK